jgi:hypothetical protein
MNPPYQQQDPSYAQQTQPQMSPPVQGGMVQQPMGAPQIYMAPQPPIMMAAPSATSVATSTTALERVVFGFPAGLRHAWESPVSVLATHNFPENRKPQIQLWINLVTVLYCSQILYKHYQLFLRSSRVSEF